MDMLNKIKGSVSINPVGYDDAMPEIVVRLDGNLLFSGLLVSPRSFPIDQYLEDGTHRLSVEFLNKTDSDTDIVAGRDKAVVIKQIEFFGISSPRFVWAGEYRPVYPSHMRDQPEILKYHDYLGWNGVWYLDFTTPIFTWIHHVEDLGWIYD